MSFSEIGDAAHAQGGGGYPPGGSGPSGGYGPPPGPGGYGAGDPPYNAFFAPPIDGQPRPGAGSGPIGGPTPFDPVEAVKFGWNAVTKDFAGVALPIVAAIVIAVIPGLVIGSTHRFVIGLLKASLDPMLLMLLNVGGQIVVQIIGMAVSAYITGGTVQFALRVCRGEKPEFGVVFSGGPFLLPLLGAQLLYVLGAGIGCFLCLVPGLVLLCAWCFYQPFVVDKGLGPIAALRASWRATAGQRANVFIYLLLSFAVSVAGALALCIGALLVSVPLLAIANCYVFLKLTGEEPRLSV